MGVSGPHSSSVLYCRWWKFRAKVAGSSQPGRSARASLSWNTLATLLTSASLSNEREITRRINTSAATCTTSSIRPRTTGTTMPHCTLSLVHCYMYYLQHKTKNYWYCRATLYAVTCPLLHVLLTTQDQELLVLPCHCTLTLTC